MSRIYQYLFKITGTTEINNGSDSSLTLNNPEFTVEYINYNCRTGVADLSIQFNEQGGIYRHMRDFSLLVGDQEQLGRDQVIGAVGLLFTAATYTIQ